MRFLVTIKRWATVQISWESSGRVLLIEQSKRNLIEIQIVNLKKGLKWEEVVLGVLVKLPAVQAKVPVLDRLRIQINPKYLEIYLKIG